MRSVQGELRNEQWAEQQRTLYVDEAFDIENRVSKRLSDYATAATVASKVIELEPFGGPGYLQRAVAHEFGGLLQKAIDEYTTAIELYGDKQKIPSATYFGLARSYDKLGQSCDAVLPIETWISLNPAQNETSQTQAMIATYRSKGKCEIATASGEEVFAVSRPNAVVKLPVSINGIMTPSAPASSARPIAAALSFSTRTMQGTCGGTTVPSRTR